MKLVEIKNCTCCGAKYETVDNGRTSEDFEGFVFFECLCGSTLMGSTAETLLNRE